MIRSLILAALCAVTPLCAATLTVTNLNDTGAGSLRDTCAAAVSGDDIVFQTGLAGTIDFTSEISLGTTALTITGNTDTLGAPTITLFRSGPAHRFLNSDTNLTVNALVMNNGASTGDGGAIRALGDVVCVGCTFTNSQSGTGGGAIYSSASVTCTDCTFADNTSYGLGGGAICGLDGVTCTGCTFSGNVYDSSVNGGGAIFTFNGHVTCTSCIFFSNRALLGTGGAIRSQNGNVTCTDCSFNGANWAIEGGAISLQNGTLTCTSCEFVNNSVYGTTAYGGAIQATGGITCTDCTFSNNTSAGAGGAVSGTGTFIGCTFSGNSASGEGGAIAIGFVTCIDCTFAGNSAGTGRCFYILGSLTLTNCIVADAGPGSMFAGSGTFTSGGYNICTAVIADVAWLNASGDQPGTDPLLGPLQDNGGPVHTMRPAFNSPAIDQGGGSTTTTDARGIARPLDNAGITNATGGDGRDVGAVEFVFNSAPVISAPATLNVARDTVFTFGGTISVADDAAATDELQLTLAATQGTLTLAQIMGLTFSAGDGTADASMEFTGTLAAINAALNGMTFTPTPAYLGAASLQIDVDDQGNAGDGPVLADSASIAITVVEQPEITLLRDGTEIASGGGDNAWGPRGSAIAITYTIRNDGITTLNVGTVAITGESNCVAVVNTAPAATVAPGGTSDFTITVTPTLSGAFTFQFSIPNDDADENPYTITVVGVAAALKDGGDSDDDDGCSTGTSHGLALLLALAALLVVALRPARINGNA